MKVKRFFEYVKGFDSLRRELMHLLQKEESESGLRTADGRNWMWHSHGAGYCFTCVEDSVVVDICYVDRVDEIEYSELSTYLGSMRRKGVKVVEQALGKRGEPLIYMVKELMCSEPVKEMFREAGLKSIA